MGTPKGTGAWSFSLGRPSVFYFCSLLVAVCAALLLRGIHPGNLVDLTNLMGPLAESLAHGRGFRVCTDAMTFAGDVLCFHASRMPLPPLLLAALIRIFHDNFLAVELTKIALVLLPVAGAVELAGNELWTASRPFARVLAPGLLFVSLVLPIQLIDVVNMQVEEGYSFCLLSYAIAALLFGVRGKAIPWRTTILFALSVVALYLTKSSMVVAAAFLALMFCVQVPESRKRLAVVLIVVCGPLGWGLYTWRASGHFSIGTSLDGINLHKGNYPQFLERYPPADEGSLDRYDASLSAGKRFSNEWVFDAFHKRAAVSYMVSHPGRALEGAFWKAQVFFFSLRKIGSEQYHGWLGRVTTISMVLFRLLLWSACGGALWFLARKGHAARIAATVYLGTVGAVAVPYLAGFALTRHAGVLIFPSALFLCWWMVSLPTLPDRLS